ncbi:MAG TPA: hypothetical protein VK689_00350 [Armatimonadota bacterium]|nr:hypothetical protein [Armatimonadota bacterium]
MVAIAGLGLAGWFLPWRMLLNVIAPPGSGPTVPGPEATDLLPRLTGAIYSNAKGQVDSVRLPGLAERRIASPTPETKTVFPSIHSVSEPDRSGRVAYVENRMGEPSTHALRFAEGAGKPVRTLFTRPGDALWDHVIGEHLTLTPDGERVAYVRNARGRQFAGAYLMQGVLELLDTRTGKTTTTRLPALDEGLSWFPDGHQLAFVGAVPRRSAPAAAAGKEGFGAGFAGWDALPVVQILDVRTGKVRKLHVGWRPRVSTDGRKVLVEDMATENSGRFGSRWRLVDVRSGASTAVTAPGAVGSVHALWPDGTVLYWGLPTAGTKLRETGSNGPLVGPKLELTLKVAVLNTTRFQTVVPYLDPRATATWGPVR